MNEKKATPNNEAAPKDLRLKSTAGNGVAAQRLRVLAAISPIFFLL